MSKRGFALLLVALFSFQLTAFAFVPALLGAIGLQAIRTAILTNSARVIALANRHVSSAVAAGVLLATLEIPSANGPVQVKTSISGQTLAGMGSIPEVQVTGPTYCQYMSTPDQNGNIVTFPTNNTIYFITDPSSAQRLCDWQASTAGVPTFRQYPVTGSWAGSVEAGVDCYYGSMTWHLTCINPSGNGTYQPTDPVDIADQIGDQGLVGPVQQYLQDHAAEVSDAVGSDVLPVSATPAPGSYVVGGHVITVGADGTITIDGEIVGADGSSSVGTVRIDLESGLPVLDGTTATPTSGTNTGTPPISGVLDITPATWSDPVGLVEDTRTFADVFAEHEASWAQSELVAGINHLFPSSGPDYLPTWSFSAIGKTYSFDLAEYRWVFDSIKAVVLVVASVTALLIILGRVKL